MTRRKTTSNAGPNRPGPEPDRDTTRAPVATTLRLALALDVSISTTPTTGRPYQVDAHRIDNVSAGIFSALMATARHYGFDYCAHVVRRIDPESYADISLRDNYPERWRQRYLAKNYVAIDPIIHVLMHDDEPRLWSTDLFDDAAAMRWDASACGLRHGWSVPVQHMPGHAGVISFVRQKTPITRKEMERLNRELTPLAEIAHLGLLGTQAHAFDAEPTLNAPKEALTGRELDVLRLSAEGIPGPEIAIALGIANNTVKYYAEEAREKLNAHNTTNAVVIAMRLGLLE